MSSVIKILPESVANQIAAGEVVQRPASVVKELVENAVDAGSTSVTVNIIAGGRELIQVMDNGQGMSEEDAKLAFERHATSKIHRADDIYSLSTFGFRGEALASIASVCEVELRTKRPEDEIGIRLLVNAGQVSAVAPVNVRNGSQFIVKNLFYNIPARRKFLKSKSVETKHVVDEFQRIALCHPEIEMALYDNDTCRYNLPAAKRRQRIVQMFGKHINANLLDLNVDTSIIKVNGFIGNPQAAKKSGASEQFLFVNNRYFRSSYFHKAIMQAYEKLIQSDVYPSYFLYMEVDPSRIDVNIHPTKTEIKFEDEQAVWQIINAAVRESLGKFGAVPLMDFDTEEPIDIPVMRADDPAVPKMPVSSLNPEFNPFDPENFALRSASGQPQRRGGFLSSMSYDAGDGSAEWQELYKESYDSFDKNSTKGDTFRSFIVDDGRRQEMAVLPDHAYGEEMDSEGFGAEDAGQGELELESDLMSDVRFLRMSRRHIVATVGGRAFFIDMTRARQRILFERFSEIGEGHGSVNQQELFPEPLSLSPEDRTSLEGIRPELGSLGFDLTDDGNGNIALRGIPADLCDISPSRLVDSLLRSLREEQPLPDRREQIAASMAGSCGKLQGNPRTDEEILYLIHALFACKEPSFTPAGKRVFSEISEDEIYKRFK